MELQITLYDALVSIDVPHDKAREVVRALERDMTTFGATKSDILPLHHDGLVLKQDVKVLRADVRELKDDVRVLKIDVAGLKEDVGVLKADVAQLKEDFRVLKVDVAALKQDVALLQADFREFRQEFAAYQVLMDRKFEQLKLEMTVRMGSLMVVGMTTLFVALKLTD